MPIQLNYEPQAGLLANVAAYAGAGPAAEQGQLHGAQLDQQYLSGLNQIDDNARAWQAQNIAAQQNAQNQAREWAGLYQRGYEAEANRQGHSADLAARLAESRQTSNDRLQAQRFTADQNSQDRQLSRDAAMDRVTAQQAGAQDRLEYRYTTQQQNELDQLDQHEQSLRTFAATLGRDYETDPGFQQAALGIHSRRAAINPRLAIAGLGSVAGGGGRGGAPGIQAPMGQGAPGQLAERLPGNLGPSGDQGQQQQPPGGWVQGPVDGTMRDPASGTIYQQVQSGSGPPHWAVLHQGQRQLNDAAVDRILNRVTNTMQSEIESAYRASTAGAAPGAALPPRPQLDWEERNRRFHEELAIVRQTQREEALPPEMRPGFNANGPVYERNPNINYTAERDQVLRNVINANRIPGATPDIGELAKRQRALEMAYGNRENMPTRGVTSPWWDAMPDHLRISNASPRAMYDDVVRRIAELQAARQPEVIQPPSDAPFVPSSTLPPPRQQGHQSLWDWYVDMERRTGQYWNPAHGL